MARLAAQHQQRRALQGKDRPQRRDLDRLPSLSPLRRTSDVSTLLFNAASPKVFFLSFFSPRSLTLPPSHNRYLARPQVKFIEPSYKTEATTYKYLGYQPKGSYRKKLEFGRKRNWKKYQAWTPPSA